MALCSVLRNFMSSTPRPAIRVEWQGVADADADQLVDAWYSQAKQGDADAQFNLGVAYATGRGVRQNEQCDWQAFVWFRRAAKLGHAGAQNSVGAMYAIGRGSERNDQQAAAWYREAAEQGHAAAQANLGLMCANGGQGVPQDDQQAYVWLSMAAANGDSEAAHYRDVVVAKRLTPTALHVAQMYHYIAPYPFKPT